MDAQTYVGRIDQMKNDAVQLKAELQRLTQQIDRLTGQIESNLTSENVPTLVASLGGMEIGRTQRGADYEVSDFAGYANFLRGLAAKKRISTWEPIGNPKTDTLLELCSRIWPLFFYREMVLGFLKDTGKHDERRIAAGMMSLVGALQGELSYIEDSDERVKNLYSQFSSEIIEPALGISVNEIQRGFTEVRRIIPARVNESFDKLEGANALHQLFKDKSDQIESDEDMRTFLESQPGFEQSMRDAQDGYMMRGRLFVFQPSDFETSLGDRARAFLEAFSFAPGSVNASLKTPYDKNEIESRPFGKIDDETYLLFNPCYCYFSPVHRLSECFATDRQKQRLTKRRDTELEDVADRHFEAIVHAKKKFRSYYIPIGAEGKLAERDLLLVEGSIAYVIESKAKPLRDISDHRGNIDKIEGDVNATIRKGYEQCVSVIEYIKSNPDGAELYDSNKPNRKVIASIKLSEISQFVPIVFLDTYFGLIATNLKPWLTVNESVGYPWVVDRDALSAFTLKITNANQFLEFVQWRRRLHGLVHNEDELCFAGYFLRHGAHKFPKKADLVQLDQNYSDVFEEEYFRRKGFEIPDKPDFVGKPHWAGMRRDGEDMVLSLAGKETEAINTRTGKTKILNSKESRRGNRVGRNDPCPCKSGLKYKKCCLRKS